MVKNMWPSYKLMSLESWLRLKNLSYVFEKGHLFDSEGHLFELEGHLFEMEGLLFDREGHLFWKGSQLCYKSLGGRNFDHVY